MAKLNLQQISMILSAEDETINKLSFVDRTLDDTKIILGVREIVKTFGLTDADQFIKICNNIVATGKANPEASEGGIPSNVKPLAERFGITEETDVANAISMLIDAQNNIDSIANAINQIYPGKINSNNDFFVYVQVLMNYIAKVQTQLGDTDAVFKNFTDLQSQVAMLQMELQQKDATIAKLNGTIQMLTMAAAAQQQGSIK